VTAPAFDTARGALVTDAIMSLRAWDLEKVRRALIDLMASGLRLSRAVFVFEIDCGVRHLIAEPTGARADIADMSVRYGLEVLAVEAYGLEEGFVCGMLWPGPVYDEFELGPLLAAR